MAGEGDGGQVVGPVPKGAEADAYDRLRRRVLWSLPTGLYVVGSGELGAGGRGNLMTANWCQQVALRPKLVAVSVEATALTATLIRDGSAFSVNLLRRSDRALIRRFVKPVTEVTRDEGGAVTAMAGQPVRPGSTGTPLLGAAAAWLECTLGHELLLGSHVLFVGEVVDVGVAAKEAEGTSGPEAEVLRMEDTRMNYGG